MNQRIQKIYMCESNTDELMIFSRVRPSGRPVDIVTIHNLMLHNLVIDPVLSFHILGAFVPLRRSIFLHAVLQSPL